MLVSEPEKTLSFLSENFHLVQQREFEKLLSSTDLSNEIKD